MNNLVTQWFQEMRQVWINQNPEEIIDLVGDTFKYYEDPREVPITNKQDLVDAREEIRDQKIMSITIESLIITESEGSAMYQFEYINEDDEQVTSFLCLYERNLY